MIPLVSLKVCLKSIYLLITSTIRMTIMMKPTPIADNILMSRPRRLAAESAETRREVIMTNVRLSVIASD